MYRNFYFSKVKIIIFEFKVFCYITIIAIFVNIRGNLLNILRIFKIFIDIIFSLLLHHNYCFMR